LACNRIQPKPPPKFDYDDKNNYNNPQREGKHRNKPKITVNSFHKVKETLEIGQISGGGFAS
jgi:hypothetical protein